MDWKIRQLEARDEEAFVQFLGRRITNRDVQKHFNWLYRGNPHGDAITWIAVLESDGSIIGCTSIFPRLMRVYGEKILGSWGGDTFVDPDFRRRGIAQSLHEYSVSDMQRLEIECHYGFPVPANFRAFIRAGAIGLNTFKLYWLPLNAEWVPRIRGLGVLCDMLVALLNPLARMFAKRKALRNFRPGLTVRIVDSFDTSVDELFESNAQRLGICCSRDAGYLNWRFAQHPFRKFMLIEWHDAGRLVAYAVLNTHAKRCQLIDFITQDDEKVGLACLASLTLLLIEKRKNTVYVKINPNGPYADLVQRSRFIKRERGRRLMVLTANDPVKDKAFGNPDNWFLMSADGDLA